MPFRTRHLPAGQTHLSISDMIPQICALFFYHLTCCNLLSPAIWAQLQWFLSLPLAFPQNHTGHGDFLSSGTLLVCLLGNAIRPPLSLRLLAHLGRCSVHLLHVPCHSLRIGGLCGQCHQVRYRFRMLVCDPFSCRRTDISFQPIFAAQEVITCPSVHPLGAQWRRNSRYSLASTRQIPSLILEF